MGYSQKICQTCVNPKIIITSSSSIKFASKKAQSRSRATLMRVGFVVVVVVVAFAVVADFGGVRCTSVRAHRRECERHESASESICVWS